MHLKWLCSLFTIFHSLHTISFLFLFALYYCVDLLGLSESMIALYDVDYLDYYISCSITSHMFVPSFSGPGQF
jgi:hypothetical protein